MKVHPRITRYMRKASKVKENDPKRTISEQTKKESNDARNRRKLKSKMKRKIKRIKEVVSI